MHHIVGAQPVAVEDHFAAVGRGDMVDYTYQSGLAGAVGAEQAVDCSFRDTDAHIVQSHMAGVFFSDVACFDNVHCM